MTMTTQGSGLLIATTFGVLLQLGCGGARSPQSASVESSSGEEETAGADAPSAEATYVGIDSNGGAEWEELLTHDDSLGDALEMGEIDCSSAHDLADSICSLAERVCAIAEDTADGETEERCVDGRSRCTRAQDRTGNRCP